MKATLIPFLLLPFVTISQNIIDHFGITTIEKIEIEFSETMFSAPYKTLVLENSRDSLLIQNIKSTLAELPSSGSVWKEFPKTIFTTQIKIFDQYNRPHQLTIFGSTLRSPERKEGAFYTGYVNGKNARKVVDFILSKKY